MRNYLICLICVYVLILNPSLTVSAEEEEKVKSPAQAGISPDSFQIQPDFELPAALFADTKHFAVVLLQQGFDKLDIDQQELQQQLTDFAKLRIKNDLSDIPIWDPMKQTSIMIELMEKELGESEGLSEEQRRENTKALEKHAKESLEIASSSSYITLEIWTVGDDYPIAFIVVLTCRPPKMCNELCEAKSYRDAILGYCGKGSLNEELKRSTTRLIEKFAIHFYKARGEL